MRMLKALVKTETLETIEDLTKKRFSCASCGNTWIEPIGLVVEHRGEEEEVCLRIGMESEKCQTCRFRSRRCQKCGSVDVYEITFSKAVPEDTPLNFKGIKKVFRA